MLWVYHALKPLKLIVGDLGNILIIVFIPKGKVEPCYT